MKEAIPHYDIISSICHNVIFNSYLAIPLSVNTYNTEEINSQVTEFQLHKDAMICARVSNNSVFSI